MVTSRISYSLHCDIGGKEHIVPIHELSRLQVDPRHDPNMLYVAMATWIPKCNMYNCEPDSTPAKTPAKAKVQLTLLDLANKSNAKVETKKTQEEVVETKKTQEEVVESSQSEEDMSEQAEEIQCDKDDDVVSITDSDKGGSNNKVEESDESEEKEVPSTPASKVGQSPRTPRTASSSKKQEEKSKAKEERERKRQEQKEEKERAKQEKIAAKQKEKQEKEEQKRKEKEEKEEQKRKEREEKEEQKRKEREEKEEQKRKEKEQKELKKQQELEEKNKDKRKKDVYKEKEAAAFANFFVSRKSINSGELKKTELRFMPFEVKSDMRLAPLIRKTLTDENKEELCDKIEAQDEKLLYLEEIKKGKKTDRSFRTWPVEDDEVVILDDTAVGEFVEEQTTATKMRAKFLHFHENRRPAYFGTWRKKSKSIKPRKPYEQDKQLFDYEVDSDDDWEEEEPGESLAGSDEEDKENNEQDDYEVDNEFFVPHGYLSDEEVGNEENEQLTPETHKEKLKILQIEFEEEMKSKTERIKPRLIGCIWEGKLKPKIQDAINKFLSERTMIMTEPIIIKKRETLADKSVSKNSPSRKALTKEFIPQFLQFIHGNVNNQSTIVKEFISYLSNKEKDVSVSKSALSAQLKQFAKWKKCPDQGTMFNKNCWYVNEDIRDQYNVNLSIINNKNTVSNDGSSDGAKKKLSL